jgi:threonine synthase
MEKKGGILHRIPGTYEDAVAASSRDAKEHGWYNANPGVEPNTRLSIEAYATISYEIYESLGYAPDVVASPVGNGTTLAGLFHGFKDLLTQGKIKKTPFMVASSTIGGNPVIKCFLDGESEIRQLKPNEIIETDVNEPLVSWISLDGQEALDALHGSSGWATYITDQEMVEYSEIMAREEGLLVLPASASSLVALNKYINEKSLKSRKSLVALLTSRKY